MASVPTVIAFFKIQYMSSKFLQESHTGLRQHDSEQIILEFLGELIHQYIILMREGWGLKPDHLQFVNKQKCLYKYLEIHYFVSLITVYSSY